MLPSRITIAALLMVGSAGAVLGQAQQPSHEAASLPSFEAVSIESSTKGQIDFRFSPRGFAARTVTLSQLIEQAYGLQAQEVVAGGPDWVGFDLFNVTATTAQEVSRDRMMLMLQSLLADRFQLQLARETQTGTIYRLTAPKVRKLKRPAKPNERSAVATDLREDCGFLSYRYDFRNATMGALALRLSQHLRAPVIDETTLTGSFDFRLDFRHDDAFGHSVDSTVPTLFRALEKQLGLTLVADRGPIPVYAIRRVSKPFAN